MNNLTYKSVNEYNELFIKIKRGLYYLVEKS